MTEWISIEDIIPNPGQIILCCDNINEIISLGRVRELEDGRLEFDLMAIEQMQCDVAVTHFMEIPMIPEFNPM